MSPSAEYVGIFTIEQASPLDLIGRDPGEVNCQGGGTNRELLRCQPHDRVQVPGIPYHGKQKEPVVGQREVLVARPDGSGQSGPTIRPRFQSCGLRL